ncbi:MAG: hypothetical protein JW938_04470 [Candidatus Omnitrophica bacterium]|nr:hypothetical protein [Candidatus Omnitrophota bacterium]
MRKHILFLTFLLCGLIANPLCVVAEDINVSSFSLLEQGTYFEYVMKKIEDSQKSIFMVMPEIVFVNVAKDSKVTLLMQALVRAKRRGVFVFVMLNLDEDRMHKPASLDAFFFLNDNGIDVHFDQLEETLSTRFIVFDRKEVIIGSTLWSDSAIAQGNQTDMYVDSEPYAKRLVDLVLNIDIYDNPLELEYYNQLYVPAVLLEHPNGMKAFVERNDLEPFMMYLYLMKKYAEAGQPEFITINAAEAIDYLQIEKGKVNPTSLQRIRGLLERLQETYVLLKFEQITADHDYNVALYSFADSSKLELPFCKDIRISANYFEAGWFRTLKVIDQYVYMYLLLIESSNGYGTWFKVTYDDFRLLPGLREDQYVASVRVLREENLIAAEYLTDETIKDQKYNSFFCLIRRPYFKSWLDKKLSELTEYYSGRLVNQAIGIAREFMLGNDPDTIERIILLLKRYSHNKINKVITDMAKPLVPEDPNKNVAFLEATLKSNYPEL